MSVLKDIEKARVRLGVTAGELARRAGIDASTYSKAISGVNAPRPATIRRLTRALERIEAEQADMAERVRKIANPKPSNERNAA